MARGLPDWYKQVVTTTPNVEQVRQVVVAADVTVNFAQIVKAWLIYNDGVNPVHWNIGAAATVNNFRIRPRTFYSADIPTNNIHFICAAGETATVWIVGVY